MLRFPSSGHHIGSRSSGGGVELDGCGADGDGGCRVSSKMGTTPFVVAGSGESGGGAAAESACRVMVDEQICRNILNPAFTCI